MATLTQTERDGLDDIFLSIDSNQDKYQRLKEISSLIFSSRETLAVSNLLKRAKYGLNETKLTALLTFFNKKKKNLSK